MVNTKIGKRLAGRTCANPNGIPLDDISKVILRHRDLETTQMYLSRISEAEALRRTDVRDGK